jgi:endonuclease/exonuclease/phosphatase family metal-dependent hydrolase
MTSGAFQKGFFILCGMLMISWLGWLHSRESPTSVRTLRPQIGQELPLKVFVLNTFFLPEPASWGSQAQGRAEFLVHEIQARQDTVVLLSETFDSDITSYLSQELQATHPYQLVGLPERTFLRMAGGLSLYSAYPILDWGVVPFETCALVDCIANKGFVWAKLRRQGVDYWVVHTHMDSGGAYANYQARMRQLVQLSLLLGTFPSDAPLIVAGDFNINGVGRFSSGYARLEAVLSPATDVIANAIPGGADRATLHCDTTLWCVDLPEVPERLDYVFWNPGRSQITVSQAAQLTYEKPCCNVPYLSDHMALEVTFTDAGDTTYAGND